MGSTERSAPRGRRGRPAVVGLVVTTTCRADTPAPRLPVPIEVRQVLALACQGTVGVWLIGRTPDGEELFRGAGYLNAADEIYGRVLRERVVPGQELLLEVRRRG